MKVKKETSSHIQQGLTSGSPPIPKLRPSQVPTSGLELSWPRNAQFALGILLCFVIVLLTIHASLISGFGLQPSTLKTGKSNFRLDINKATAAELMQLPDVGPKTAEMIIRYRKTNGNFQKLEDLTTIKGLGPKTVEGLRDFIVINGKIPQGFNLPPIFAKEAPSPKLNYDHRAKTNTEKRININTAGKTELMKLKGIGITLAQRIIEEREKELFSSVEDLQRVYRIGPKTVARLKPYITVGD